MSTVDIPPSMNSLTLKENVLYNYFKEQVDSKPMNSYILYSDPGSGIRMEHSSKNH